MARKVKITPLTATLLRAGAGLVDALPSDQDFGPLLEAIGPFMLAIADAGGTESDDGRYVSPAESHAILRDLVTDLDYAAAQIPADAIAIPAPAWAAAAFGALGMLLRGDGLVGIAGSAVRALGDAVRDGVVDAQELRVVIATIREAAATV